MEVARMREEVLNDHYAPAAQAGPAFGELIFNSQSVEEYDEAAILAYLVEVFGNQEMPAPPSGEKHAKGMFL